MGTIELEKTTDPRFDQTDRTKPGVLGAFRFVAGSQFGYSGPGQHASIVLNGIHYPKRAFPPAVYYIRGYWEMPPGFNPWCRSVLTLRPAGETQGDTAQVEYNSATMGTFDTGNLKSVSPYGDVPGMVAGLQGFTNVDGGTGPWESNMFWNVSVTVFEKGVYYVVDWTGPRTGGSASRTYKDTVTEIGVVFETAAVNEAGDIIGSDENRGHHL